MPQPGCPCPPSRTSVWGERVDPPHPGCRQHSPPSAWPDPPAFEHAETSFTAHAEGLEWGKSVACRRCGAIIAGCLDTSAQASGRRAPDGRAAHAEWHRELDWLHLLGPKAPLYAAAGWTLDAAAAAELDDAPPTVSALRASAALLGHDNAAVDRTG